MFPSDQLHGAYPVVASMRAGQRGWCMPILIHNMHHFYTKLCAFEDGVVDCWEGLDLPLFHAKLQTHWVAVGAPEGARFSTHGLGSAQVRQCEPLFTKDDIAARVEAAIRFYNPTLAGLVDLEGSSVTRRGRAGVAKLPSLDGTPVRLDDGASIRGYDAPVVLRDGRSCRITPWFVYADGTSRIGPEGALVDLAVAEDELRSGRVTTSVPDDTWVEVDGVGRFQFQQGRFEVQPLERIREQRDQLVQLTGGQSARAACLEAWAAYQDEPSEACRELLRNTYLAVPAHHRMFCGDMDEKDRPIRRALGLP